MNTYPFADLDQNDLNEIRGLESRLTQKQGREIILIAYCAQQGQEDGSSLASYLSDPAEYGAIATAQESGLLT